MKLIRMEKKYNCYCSKCMNGIVVKDSQDNYFCDKCFAMIKIELSDKDN